MATILERRLTLRDSTADILLAIEKIASDKHGRVTMDDQIEWLETKLREIARLARILQRRDAKGAAVKRKEESVNGK